MSWISRKKQYKTDYADELDSDMDWKTDILIFPGDAYPNRKVKLEDVDIKEESREKFEKMCDQHLKAFFLKTIRT